ncbi:hypothetical protein C8R44DRAFT_977387 [Mycena epipterygia]|nr:hypothetical protein C8R44DRAFT_977387 [Mycena epipterygia]
MRLISSILTFCTFYIATVWAQATELGSPLPGAILQFNTNFTVQLILPISIEGSIDVGIAIGLLSCPTSEEATCPPPADELGDVLFVGPFNPTLHPMAMFYENFTVTVPSEGFPVGRAQLTIARFHLVGAGATPTVDFNNITVNLSN